MTATTRLGIDVGGSGIKAALVDTERGDLVGDRLTAPTPEPATPTAIAAAAARLAERLGGPSGRAGVVLPCVIRAGVARTAANLDPGWIGTDVADLFRRVLARPVAVLNDADAAGIAELRFGAGRDQAGTVVLCTLGTGIGSAVFLDGRLLPNTELGHIEVRGLDGEKRAAASVRTIEKLTWPAWSERLDEYLHRIEDLLWPDLIILGGGISRDAARFIPRLTTRTPVVAAELRNAAGIVGAALAAVMADREEAEDGAGPGGPDAPPG